jgi:predicted transcriptional regulator
MRMPQAQRSLERERALVIRRLNRKVGSISEQAIDSINELSIAQLESLGDAMLDFESIADLTGWLSPTQII